MFVFYFIVLPHFSRIVPQMTRYIICYLIRLKFICYFNMQFLEMHLNLQNLYTIIATYIYYIYIYIYIIFLPY